MPVSKALREALQWGQEEVAELADDLLDHKVFTYVETLADLAREHGADVDEDDIVLSDAILHALRDEARAHAQMVVDTYNKDLGGFLERNGHLPRETLLQTYEAWADSRADARAEQLAITEAYSAAADAEVAFYTANAGELEFDFGGHPEHGDVDPECDVCQALVATSPHPLERVLAIGNPHPGCRQGWHPSDVELPDELNLPEAPAGIVGADAIVIREGGHSEAVARIEELAGGLPEQEGDGR